MKTLTIMWLLIGGVVLSAATDKVSQAESVAMVRLVPPAGPGRPAISVDGRPCPDPKPDREAQVLNGVSFQAGNVRVSTNFTSLLISSREREATVEIKGYDNWSARIPKGDTLVVHLSNTVDIIDMFTPTNNSSNVALIFFDGGHAEMGPGSYARYDQFRDRTYYLSGRGKVKAQDADGEGRVLSQFLPPITGGPLVRTNDAKGETRWNRLNPITEVVIAGQAGQELEIYVGKRKIILDRKGRDRVELPNGTVFDLVQNPNSNYLDWNITKGFCRFWVGDVDCWQVLGLTEQEASQVWDGASAAVDISNYTRTNTIPPNQDLLVRIANRISISFAPGVAFQYASLGDCTTFTGSSKGGESLIYNPVTQQITSMTEGNSTFRRGVPASGGSLPRNSMQLSWGDTGDLNVSGSMGDFKVSPKGKKFVQGENAGSVEVSFAEKGEITVNAVASDYSVRLSPLKNWGVEMGEGDAMQLTYDGNSGVFVARASPENATPIRFTTPEGLQSPVVPGGAITVVVNREGSLLSQGRGSITYFEGDGAAGSSGSLTFGASPTGGTLPPIGSTIITYGPPSSQVDPTRVVDPTRIPQPPITPP